uniref:Uncharacterized protein n=1 Tax=Fagus sylvatica TaxID=28930 RepID=A0A2N9FV40_FAGSY
MSQATNTISQVTTRRTENLPEKPKTPEPNQPLSSVFRAARPALTSISKSLPPPLPFPTFCFTPHPSDLVLYGRDLLEALGDSSLHRPLSLLLARICHSSGRRDHRRQWMFGGHPIWGLLPSRPSIDPTFGVDSLKLFLKSPYHTRIAWHLLPWQTRFDSVVYLAGITAPNLLLLRTLIIVVALVLI